MFILIGILQIATAVSKYGKSAGFTLTILVEGKVSRVANYQLKILQARIFNSEIRLHT
jgi:hypothetical protein